MARTEQVEIFCSYAHADEELRSELFRHFEVLRLSGIIKTWHDGEIAAGQDWRHEIEKHLRSADVIVLLVSVDLLNSEFVHSVELPLALKRHSQGEALVIPVLLRPTTWEWSGLSALQGLPDGLRPVVQWMPRDLAWVSVCEGLVRAILVWKGSEAVKPSPRPVARADSVTRRRVFDVGLPRRVPVGLSTVLAVMVRPPESEGLAGLLDLQASYGVAPDEVKSTQKFPVTFNRTSDGTLEPAELSVVVETSDFTHTSRSKSISVPARGDSDVCVFLLTALRTGLLRLNVELVFGGKRVTNCLLSSHGVEGVGFEPAVQASVGLDLGSTHDDTVTPFSDRHKASPPPASLPPPAPRRSRSGGWYKAARAMALGVILISGASVLLTKKSPSLDAPQVGNPTPQHPGPVRPYNPTEIRAGHYRLVSVNGLPQAGTEMRLTKRSDDHFSISQTAANGAMYEADLRRQHRYLWSLQIVRSNDPGASPGPLNYEVLVEGARLTFRSELGIWVWEWIGS